MTMAPLGEFYTDLVFVEEQVTVRTAVRLMKEKGARIAVFVNSGVPTGICDRQDLFIQVENMDSIAEFSPDFTVTSEGQMLTENVLAYNYLLVQNEEDKIIGWIDHNNAEIQYLRQRLSDDVKELTADLEAIVDSVYDEILVVDSRGTVVRVSMRSMLNLWGISPKQVIGMNILELEKKGWFKPSVTRKVLDEKKKVSVIQKNRFGRTILAVGNPVFNRNKKIERIVIASRDITEVSELENELKRAQQQTERYKQEIQDLQKFQLASEKRVVFRSERMRELMERVERIAKVESTVTVYGESGVGKELIVNAIHHYSNRADQPFVKINCSSLPSSLLESELFGYEKGAFTGALRQGKKGYFELADKGTLFLDEVAEIPLELQAKLLRAIQEQEILKVGASRPMQVDVRIIAATNRNLEEMVQEGTFREDLFYRLHVIPLYVPALRERIEDIEPLIYYFTRYFNQKFSMNKRFSEGAVETMNAYEWPGNVRELRNVVERAMAVTSSPLITANKLAEFLHKKKAAIKPVQVNSIIPLQKAIDLTESQLIHMALSRYKTITKAAEVLGVSQPTVSRRYQKLFQAKEKNEENL